MNGLVCIEPFKFEYRHLPEPLLTHDHVLLQIKRIGVCGTDIHAFDGTQPYFTYPRILGHELAADIIELNKAGDFEDHETVTIIPYFNCGNCIACRSGKPNCCVKMKVCGVHVDGGMVEYLSVPVTSLVHGEELNYDEMALIEPLAIGAHAVGRAEINAGEFVLVIGMGPIGLGIIEFAKIAGANVIAMDINEAKLSFCKEKLKIENIINAGANSVTEQLKQFTNGDMPAVIIDATGSLKAINNAFQYMTHGATFVLVGLQKGDISFSHPEFHKREATLMSSRNATRKDFEYVIECIKKRIINPLDYITHRVNFNAVKDEFPNFLNPDIGLIKAMIEMKGE